MDTAQWPQEIVVKPIEEIVTSCPKQQQLQQGGLDQRKVARPQKEQALNCPRCNSTNTKFCYYNNYSLTQPRYFCKTCRRYWTEGGSLRNIPVGGGSRKNKRSSSSSSSNPSKKLPDLVTPPTPSLISAQSKPQNPKIHEGQDLNLAFPAAQDFRTISELVQAPNNNNMDHHLQHNKSHNISSSALELLTGITNSSRGGFSSFMPLQDPNTVYTSGFSLQEFKPASLNFSLDGLGTNYGGSLHQETTTSGSSGGRLLFPFEDLKQPNNVNHDHHHQNREQGDISTGYWTGMMGGGSW